MKCLFYLLCLSSLLCARQKEIPFIQLTDHNYREVILESDRPVILDVISNSCSACDSMQPVLYQIYKQYKNKVDFVQLDFKQFSRFAMQEFKITHLPTFIFFLDGLESGRAVGFLSKNKFKEKIKRFFDK